MIRFVLAVNVCSVQPTAAVIVVGERVSLNCTATGDNNYIDYWQIGTDVKDRVVVYLSQLYGPNRTVRRNESVADGYSVENVSENKISLHIKKIIFSQAGLYACQCGDQSLSAATTAMVVLGR